MAKAEPFRRLKIGVLGCGNMGGAMVRGLVEDGYYPQNILVYDVDAKKISAIKKEASVRSAKSNRQVASICDVLLLAVKPQTLPSLLEEISLCTSKHVLVISIAAGIPVVALQKGFKEKVGVVRAMPNMPAQVGEGMTAYCAGPYTTAHHEKIAEAVLGAMGEVVPVREGLMDLVTAISGSGPAYFFLLAQLMIQAACEMGMKADVAKKLVYQTMLGSAKTLSASDADPEELIARVASKKGTTEAALKVFKQKGFGKIVLDAVRAAHDRSEELRVIKDA